MNWSKIQTALYERGFDPKSMRSDGKMDGIPGRNTSAAVKEFQRSQGLPATGVVDEVTHRRLFPSAPTTETVDPPWMVLLAAKMGLHEIRDKAELSAFLKSDGAFLGDPSKLPWCGDLVETVIAVTLQNEVLPTNPYLARNWQKFGRGIDDALVGGEGYGVIAVFWRTHKTQSSNGHVGFLVGRNQSGSRVLVRGGNQSNSITDSWLDTDRLLAVRAPTTWRGRLRPLPVLDSSGAVLSTNEA